MHAAGESSPGNLPPHTIAVVLSADDEKHLLEIEQKLINNGVPHRAIREPDMGNSLTAIGIVPDSRSKLKPYFKKLQLLK